MKTNKRRYTKKKKSRKNRKYGGNLGKIARTASVALKKIATEYGKNQGEKIFRDKPNILSYALKSNSKKNKIIMPSNYNIKKGGFKADVVDNLEDRDDDWVRVKQ